MVAPTRELALQVSSDLHLAGADLGLRVLTVYGGVGYDTQLDALETGVDVVVGTPGRLLDLADRRALDLSHVHGLVLDEADEMLDLGFLPDVERLIAKTPEKRQTMLFSATMPSAIVGLARRHMRRPMNIRAESSTDTQTVPLTTQFVYQAHDLDKPEIIARVLQAPDCEKDDRLHPHQAPGAAGGRRPRRARLLRRSLHGDLQQTAREKAMARFREDKVKVLVATDVAARGIDVAGVSHVINYTCPEEEKTYLHRIGRTVAPGLRRRADLRRLVGTPPQDDDQQRPRAAVPADRPRPTRPRRTSTPTSASPRAPPVGSCRPRRARPPPPP